MPLRVYKEVRVFFNTGHITYITVHFFCFLFNSLCLVSTLFHLFSLHFLFIIFLLLLQGRMDFLRLFFVPLPSNYLNTLD